jgi:hypothetical protein
MSAMDDAPPLGLGHHLVALHALAAQIAERALVAPEAATAQDGSAPATPRGEPVYQYLPAHAACVFWWVSGTGVRNGGVPVREAVVGYNDDSDEDELWLTVARWDADAEEWALAGLLELRPPVTSDPHTVVRYWLRVGDAIVAFIRDGVEPTAADVAAG